MPMACYPRRSPRRLLRISSMRRYAILLQNAINNLFLANLHNLQKYCGMSEVRSKRVRQADIASRAGVSVSTVSRVLTNEPGISDTIRQQIFKVASDLGYPLKQAAEAVPAASGADRQRQRHGRPERLLRGHCRGPCVPARRNVACLSISGSCVKQGQRPIDIHGISPDGRRRGSIPRRYRSIRRAAHLKLEDSGTPVVLVNGTDSETALRWRSPLELLWRLCAATRRADRRRPSLHPASDRFASPDDPRAHPWFRGQRLLQSKVAKVGSCR